MSEIYPLILNQKQISYLNSLIDLNSIAYKHKRLDTSITDNINLKKKLINAYYSNSQHLELQRRLINHLYKLLKSNMFELLKNDQKVNDLIGIELFHKIHSLVPHPDVELSKLVKAQFKYLLPASR